MPANQSNRLLACSQKIYRWLLRAYPRAHQQEYGADMSQLFRDQCRDAWAQSQGRGLLKLWLRVLPDLVSTSITEHISAFNPRKSMTAKLAGLTRQTTALSVFAVVFIVVFLAVVMISTAITFILPESYASTARMKVEADPQPGQSQLVSAYDPYFIQTTFEIIQSELVLSNVVASQDLNRVWGKKYNNGEPFKTAESIELLKTQMTLSPVRNTRLIAITVYSTDKNEASNLANAIAKAYQDYRIQGQAEMMAAGVASLYKQYAGETAQISQLETEINSLGSKSDIASGKLLAADQQKLEQLRSQHQTLQARLASDESAFSLPNPAQIIDPAMPGLRPVKPNKTLNIALGAIIGIFLAAVVGCLAMLVVLLFKKSNTTATAA